MLQSTGNSVGVGRQREETQHAQLAEALQCGDIARRKRMLLGEL